MKTNAVSFPVKYHDETAKFVFRPAQKTDLPTIVNLYNSGLTKTERLLNMKTIQVNAYEYNELNDQAKLKVKYWLDEHPICYEEDEQQFVSNWDEDVVLDHCQANEYLFDKYGKPIHHLEIIKNKEAA